MEMGLFVACIYVNKNEVRWELEGIWIPKVTQTLSLNPNRLEFTLE